MTLTPGSRVGPYEIQAAIGAGGMGEVYRARDTKLGREVALKVLPATFTHDAERVARFKREAQLLATLNHPNIAGIYGLDEALIGEPAAAPIQFLTLELVDGETLASRLERGALPVEEAIGVARQIGDALQAAHDKGIVHRDLKPANIAFTAEGQVKVLDFGLAKALEQGVTSGSASVDSLMQSPTITTPAMTQAGVILGTAAYMSPEQAKGRTADKRTDVWAFGCVFYEMLTARRAFEGEDVSDTLAAVLRGEPDWNALPQDLPHAARLLIRRCLERDRRRRIGDISTGLFLLDQLDAIAAAAPIGLPTADGTPLRWKLAVAALALVIASGGVGALVAWRMRSEPPAPVVTRVALTVPEDQTFTATGAQMVAVSPDGSNVVYVANRRLYLRAASDLEPRPIPGTDLNPRNPVFSPTGEFIVFGSQADRSLKRMAITGGAPVTVTPPLDTAPLGLSWAGDFIFFGDTSGPGGISRVPASGGKPERMITIDPDQFAHGPRMLPDGDHVIFTLLGAPRLKGNAMAPSWVPPLGSGGPERWDKAQVVVQSLRTGERKTLIEGGSDARYLPTGHLVYAAGGVVFAVRFDADTLEVLGGATPVIEGVRRPLEGASGTAHFDVSSTGVLVYLPGPTSLGGARRMLGRVDRKGAVELLKVPTAAYYEPRLSPDGTRVAVVIDDDRETNVWVYDLAATSSMRRLAVAGRNRHPIWSPDGRHIAFQSDREGDLAIFRQPSDGSGVAQRLTTPEKGTAHVPESWSSEGKLLVGVAKGQEFWSEVLSLDDRTLTPLAGVRSTRRINAAFSPDGRWVAYTIMKSDQRSIFVRPFPPTGEVYQLTNAGHHPFWSRDGRELYYIPTGFQLAVVTVTLRPSFAFSEPTVLSRGAPSFFEGGPQNTRQNDTAVDGRVIGVFPAPDSSAGATTGHQILLVLNWFDELKARLPVGR